MVEASSIPFTRAIENRRSGLPRPAIHCSGIHARAARGIWPRKTAEHWASAAGVKARMARYWLAGTHEVSDSGKLALINVLR